MGSRADIETLALGVLQVGDSHGYQIAKRIRSLSGSALSAGDAKLYPALHRLEKDGLVVARWEPQEGKPPRKIYGLTVRGRTALEERRAEWQQFSSAVNRILFPADAWASGVAV